MGSWSYNYNLFPHTAVEREWITSNQIEFRPMVFGAFVNINSSSRCYFAGAQPSNPNNQWHNAPDCTLGGAEIIERLKDTEQELGGNRDSFTKIKTLMLANEPWWNAEAFQDPNQYVEYYRKYLQPAAKALGVELGSMNTRPD